ncbi:hypothetical protein B0H13DRAFT_1905226 [Mycena leptocephala]|nr:hypothetical protein B0H13DRAFT_1905226 [Mycena leptocephala]
MLSKTRALLGIIVFAANFTRCAGQINVSCMSVGSAFDCTSFIPTFCDSIGTISVGAGNTALRCFLDSPTTKCDLIALNVVTSGGVPDVGKCAAALETLALECPMVKGGSAQFIGDTFQYGIDPNQAACGIPPGN